MESPTAEIVSPPVSPLWLRKLTQKWPRLRAGRSPRRLRLCESLSLGEKRFIAVVQFDAQQFLVGGGSHGVSLLARLGDSGDFATALSEWSERQR